jgi:hypothetical protein
MQLKPAPVMHEQKPSFKQHVVPEHASTEVPLDCPMPQVHDEIESPVAAQVIGTQKHLDVAAGQSLEAQHTTVPSSMPARHELVFEFMTVSSQ